MRVKELKALLQRANDNDEIRIARPAGKKGRYLHIVERASVENDWGVVITIQV